MLVLTQDKYVHDTDKINIIYLDLFKHYNYFNT